MASMSFDELLEKTASLLEQRAAELDSTTQAKTAADREERERRLAPAIERYESLNGTKLSEEQLEEVYSGDNEFLIEMIEKLAATDDSSLEEMGGPEEAPPVFRRNQMPSQSKTASEQPSKRQVHHRGRRRDSRELKRATKRRERGLRSAD